MTIPIASGAMRTRGRALAARAAACLLLLALGLAASMAAAQGRPAILWSAAGHGDTVSDVDVSPDGTLLATSSLDSTIKLWRYPQGDLVRTLVLPYDIDDQVTGIVRVRFISGGAYVVAAVNHYDAHADAYSGALHVFRVGDGAPVREFARQGAGIASIDVSPDEAWIATAGMARGVEVWRLADGALVTSLHHAGAASDVHFSPAGDRLCAGFADLHLVSWKTSHWSLQWDVAAHDESITRTVFSNDGEQIATASIDGTARLFDAATGTLLHTLSVGTALYAAVFDPDGRHLATAGLDGRIRSWDIADGSLVRKFAGGGGSIASLGYANGGRALISGGEYPSRIREWNPADGSLLRFLTRLASPVDRVAFSPDSEMVATSLAFEQRVDVFRAGGGRRLYSWKTESRSGDIAFSPTQALVATPGADHTVVIRRLSDGKVVQTLVGHDEEVVGLAFSHDGTLLASGSYFPGTIRLWRTSDWSLVRVIEAGLELDAFGPFESFSFSADDTLLGMVAEGSPLVVRVSDGTVAAHLAGISRSTKFSPDGGLFVTSGGVYTDEVDIYRVSDWTRTATLPTGANDIAFTPDGSRLMAAQFDAMRSWRTSDWMPVLGYDQELGYIGAGAGPQTLAISPDGARLAYGRDDATLVMARVPLSGGGPGR